MPGKPTPITKVREREKTGKSLAEETPKKSVAKDNKVQGFCHICGEESHYLSNCTNPVNAELVQQKLEQKDKGLKGH